MHGRPRLKGPEDQERTKAAKQKAALFGQLAKEVLGRRQAKRYDEESLGLSAKLLELNPEVYTVWNYRREALQPVLDAGGAAAVQAAEQELGLAEKALLRNPKSYSAWHHRKWVVARRFTSLERELKLVGMLLDADERNFHGWNYRRFVLELMGTPAERALDYTRNKIDQNFSNYSAWHSRTVLLPIAHAGQEEEAGEGVALVLASAATAVQQGGGGGGGPGGVEGEGAQVLAGAERRAAEEGGGSRRHGPLVPKAVLDEEYELVRQAFYTEPEDQSGWFYHRWLLGSSWAHWERARHGGEEAAEREALMAVVSREQAMCQDLLDIEPDSKWPLLTMARLKEMQLQLAAAAAGQGGAGEGGVRDSNALLAAAAAAAAAGGAAAPPAPSPAQQRLSGEVAGIYAKLAEVDPLRGGYYMDAVEGRASVVAGQGRQPSEGA